LQPLTCSPCGGERTQNHVVRLLSRHTTAQCSVASAPWSLLPVPRSLPLLQVAVRAPNVGAIG